MSALLLLRSCVASLRVSLWWVTVTVRAMAPVLLMMLLVLAAVVGGSDAQFCCRIGHRELNGSIRCLRTPPPARMMTFTPKRNCHSLHSISMQLRFHAILHPASPYTVDMALNWPWLISDICGMYE